MITKKYKQPRSVMIWTEFMFVVIICEICNEEKIIMRGETAPTII